MTIEKRSVPINILLILLAPIVGMALGVALTSLLGAAPETSNLIVNGCFLLAVALLVAIFKPSSAELGVQLIPAQMGRHWLFQRCCLVCFMLNKVCVASSLSCSPVGCGAACATHPA